jgi:hypothetical protein
MCIYICAYLIIQFYPDSRKMHSATILFCAAACLLFVSVISSPVDNSVSSSNNGAAVAGSQPNQAPAAAGQLAVLAPGSAAGGSKDSPEGSDINGESSSD